jgi:hypothetical protein
MSFRHAASSYKKHNAKLTEQIVEKVRGKVELQTLVLAYIDSYETAQRQAAENGETVAEAMMAKRKPSITDLSESPGTRPIIDPATPLPRNCASYKVWGQKLLADLLIWVEPGCLGVYGLHGGRAGVAKGRWQ